MEFTCVFSIAGSLATYQVQQQTEDLYTATLRAGQGGRTDIPAELQLQRTGEGWQSSPPQDEILRNLVHAIEGTGPAVR